MKANLLNNRWVRVAVIGVAYFVIGYGSTFLVQPSIQFWRRAAWVGSAVVYILHVVCEHFRLRRSTATTAINVGLAVAVGGFLLAVAATMHAPFLRFLIALIAWPLITGVPAFLVTLVIAGALRWLRIPRAPTT